MKDDQPSLTLVGARLFDSAEMVRLRGKDAREETFIEFLSSYARSPTVIQL